VGGIVSAVGQGYFSPAGDCSRYQCTNIHSELLDVNGIYYPVGSDLSSIAQYVSDGNGTDACEWVCVQGGWYRTTADDQGGYQCKLAGTNFYSLPMENAKEMWCVKSPPCDSCKKLRDALWCVAAGQVAMAATPIFGAKHST
jgi:hypothetical protein